MLKNNPKDILDPINNTLSAIYRGIVEDNKSDPEKLGRCKVRVFGIHSPNKVKTSYDGIPTDELPWCEPVMGLFEGSVSGFGSFTVPLQGSHVMIFFEGGNIMKPRYFATVPGKPTDQNHGLSEDQGFSDPDKKYPIKEIVTPHQPNGLDESDFHKLARGETDGTIVESKNSNRETSITSALSEPSWDEPASAYNTTYPDNKVFATRSGITIEIDDTDNEERVHLYHPSGTFVEIDTDGNMTIRNAKDKFIVVDRDKKEYIQRDNNINIVRDKIEKIGGIELKEVGGDVVLYIKGKLYISTDNGIDLWSGANINLDAPQIFNNTGRAYKKKTR